MDESTQLTDLPRPEVTDEEKVHETQVRLLNNQFPDLDPLMCSVLLKCPPELMAKLRADPAMWRTPPASTHVLTGNVIVSDPEPERPDSPRSVLPDN